ncbi:MAG: dephospho-CoA kinase [Candidatus Marinimicrobia bacterium]|nr:dephospho-CoA kinase [Candidatus Neomarinimicrobiota bacterium]|tara:strand:- start:3652 stop:4254 length:603 start_codon:yes stop_codon:yes gene_type:complete
MIKIGITGGIASGKTTAANCLDEQEGTYIFNADQKSKAHLKKSLSLQKKIINIFGNQITVENKIDFNLLAKVAFKNKTNHTILNGIMWPEVFLLINKEYEKIKNNKKYNSFIVDAALLFEANYQSFFDYTILVTANEKKRLSRAIKRDNISLENIQNRISLQMPESKKKYLADYTINNNHSFNNLFKKINGIYSDIISVK